jgi:transcriptional regulator with XRE-family HTH domain
VTPDFGKALQAARRERELSQEQLALDAGLHYTHVSLLERGLREPSLETLVKLCRALDVSPAEAIMWHMPGPRAMQHARASAARNPPERATVGLSSLDLADDLDQADGGASSEDEAVGGAVDEPGAV